MSSNSRFHPFQKKDSLKILHPSKLNIECIWISLALPQRCIMLKMIHKGLEFSTGWKMPAIRTTFLAAFIRMIYPISGLYFELLSKKYAPDGALNFRFTAIQVIPEIVIVR